MTERELIHLPSGKVASHASRKGAVDCRSASIPHSTPPPLCSLLSLLSPRGREDLIYLPSGVASTGARSFTRCPTGRLAPLRFYSSFLIPHSSFLIPHSSFLIPHSPPAPLCSLLSLLSPRGREALPFPIPHSPFPIPHSPFSILHPALLCSWLSLLSPRGREDLILYSRRRWLISSSRNRASATIGATSWLPS